MKNVEIQYFRGCPNSEEMIKRVRESVKGLEDINYIETLVETNEKANEVKFLGSPTLLIDGIDFEERTMEGNPSLNCRVYENGLPSVFEIKQKILS